VKENMGLARILLGAAVGGLVLLLFVRRDEKQPEPEPEKKPWKPGVVPPGWRRMQNNEVTPELREAAVRILHGADPVGAVVAIDETHAALIEPHGERVPRGVSLIARLAS
jgi:hypothetical protein